MILVKTHLSQSKLHGIGLFASEDIKKGAKVWEYTPWFDLALKKDQIDNLSNASRVQFLNYAYISKQSGKYILCSDDARFFNHENKPNVKCAVPINSDVEDCLECVAVRDIMAGEELTCDYREFDADPYDVV